MSNEMQVSKRMIPIAKVPNIAPQDSLKKALDSMTRLSLGICIIRSEEGKLEGILTDGDLRRLILTVQNPLPALLVSEAMAFGTRNPKYVFADSLIGEAITLMDEKQIWDLPVLDSEGKVTGVLNRHNLD